MWWQPLAAWKVWLEKACADAALFVRWKTAVPLSVGAFLASGTAGLMVAPMTLLMAVSEWMIAATLATAAAPMMAAVPLAADSAMVNSGFPQGHWVHRMVKTVARYVAHHWTLTPAMALLQ